MINKDTKICISISSNPSDFGTIVHNAAYKSLGLNYIYKSFYISDLENVIRGIRAIGIHGCSVSMPFKTKVIKYIDKIDVGARAIGAVNTILNKNGVLTGYNTDYNGALSSLEFLKVNNDQKILILGAGGVSRSILLALRDLGYKKVYVSSRNLKKTEVLDKIMYCKKIRWKDRNKVFADLIINATPIGMKDENYDKIIDSQSIIKSQAIMDVVVHKNFTSLMHMAKSHKKKIVDGRYMTLEQAVKQFFIYTGVNAPREVMLNSINSLFNNKVN